MVRFISLLAVGLILVHGVVLTFPAWAQNPNTAVKSCDTNGDGYITADEFTKKWGVPYSAANSGSGGGASDSDTIIADVHMHLQANNAPQHVLAWMDRNKVQWAGLGAL